MNARVRRFDSSTISTIVRNALQLYAVRLEFLVGGRIAPRAVTRQAAELFTRPFRSSRSALPTAFRASCGIGSKYCSPSQSSLHTPKSWLPHAPMVSSMLSGC